jgi:hypothetical protein
MWQQVADRATNELMRGKQPQAESIAAQYAAANQNAVSH